MHLAQLLGPDLQEALNTDPSGIVDALEEFHPEDIADLVEELPEKLTCDLMRILPTTLGADVIERVNSDLQEAILRSLAPQQRAALLSEVDPDDRVDILQELPQEDARRALEELERNDPVAASEVRELRVYDESTAGGLMTTDFVTLSPDVKVWEAIDTLRDAAHGGEAEIVYYTYVVNSEGQLLGVVSLRDLIINGSGQALSDIMTEKIVKVDVHDDQEEVAHAIARYDLTAVPVVDNNNRILGLVTVDDVVDVVIEEATEDAQKMSAVLPLEDSYFETGLGEFIWKRATWLVVLFFGQLLTATVMEENEDALQTMIELVVFIPLIIASGGNAGGQSSTLVIRALAVGEIRSKDWLRVLSREVIIGIAIGLCLGLIGFMRAFLFGEGQAAIQLAVIAGTGILCIVTLGTIIGSLLPIAIRKAGLDPAVSSAPFIASLIDVIGLIVYFGLARWVIGGGLL